MLTLNKVGDGGEKSTWYSHSSFLSTHQKQVLQKGQAQAAGYAKFAAGLLALGAVLGTSKVPALGSVTKKVHPLALGGGLFVVGWWGFGKIFSSMENSNAIKIIQSEGAIPLWKNPNNVVNLDRLFFSLDDSKHNQPNILHDGLTVQNAGKLYPDMILGTFSNVKPRYPSDHSHDHGHH